MPATARRRSRRSPRSPTWLRSCGAAISGPAHQSPALLCAEELCRLCNRRGLDPEKRGKTSLAAGNRVTRDDVDLGGRKRVQRLQHRADPIVALIQEAGLLHGKLDAKALRDALKQGGIGWNQVELRLPSAREGGEGEQVHAFGRESPHDLRALSGPVR